MWHLTACKISVSLSFLKRNDFYRISELIVSTLIQRHDKKIISFLIQFKNERLPEILQAVRCHTLSDDHINIIHVYKFIKPFLEKMSIF